MTLPRLILIPCLLFVLFAPAALSNTVQVGAGSYTTVFPGVDEAGRNGFPGGQPQLSGPAAGRPVPTNDWWSSLLNRDHVDNLYNYPMAMRTLSNGLSVGRVEPADLPNGSAQPLSDVNPIIVGVTGLNGSRVTVHDYSDWTVTMDWEDSAATFQAQVGVAMPFIYMTKGSSDVARVIVNVGTPSIDGETLLVTDSGGGASFAIYAPEGSTWTPEGNAYTSTLNGQSYWAMAILPENGAVQAASDWRRYAFVEPVDTRVSWDYNEESAVMRATYTTTVQVHEGGNETVLQGLLPHQWSQLSSDAPALTDVSLPSIRGELKLLASNSFSTERVFQGILPALPALGARSDSYDPAVLQGKIQALEDESLSTWTDSYNDGQVLNRLIQTARIAHEIGNLEARDKMIATIKERVEDWLSYEAGEIAFLFYYNEAWTAMLGYPPGHGQDSNLNDHHFHWGYFIHAAAFMEQFEPGWAEEWGPMVELLIRDAASDSRSDPLFPFLRSFSPYCGHAWANGFATFPFGNDQESSSESMQFNSALIHWGEITGNDAIRDLGIYLYTTEQTAIEEYWLDINDRTLKPNYGFSLVSRLWGNGYDNQTFWTSDIAAAYGIQLYPIHGGSLYLGQNVEYAESLWAEMAANTNVLNNPENPNLWHDTYWKFLAFTDPATALERYNSYPERELKFGISDVKTYYWLHSMNALGRVDTSVTSNSPLAAVFNLDGTRTYVAHNYSSDEQTVTFSDGTELTVPANSMATNHDVNFTGVLTTPFAQTPARNTVSLTVEVAGETETITAVEVYANGSLLERQTEAPYVFRTDPLNAGRASFFARIYAGDSFTITNIVTVQVGEMLPYLGFPAAIPGTIEGGHYDSFEGSSGQGRTYRDTSPGNNGDFRLEEDVDARTDGSEGAVVGWTVPGEWLEYTTYVSQSGLYNVDVRYASGNPVGGGPIYLEFDGIRVSENLALPTTTDWADFRTASLRDVPLPQGRGTLRLVFSGGEVDIGRMTFNYAGPRATEPPMAHAGVDTTLQVPASEFTFDSSGTLPGNDGSLAYLWEQTAGPAVVQWDDITLAAPTASGLDVDGLYVFRLVVTEGQLTDSDEVRILRGGFSNLPPTVRILSPSTSSVLVGTAVEFTVSATDSDGDVVRVDLYKGDYLIAFRTETPYRLSWSAPPGTHELTAVATDSDGQSSTSSAVQITGVAPTSCLQESASGDFSYEFGELDGQATITFIPARSGVGSPTLLFYYGSGSGPYPGYLVTPNTPFVLNASSGEQIGFYFTYSVPEGGERNSLAENASATIGACGDLLPTAFAPALIQWRREYFGSDMDSPELEAIVWGNDADPDNDGLSNRLEFATGSNPLQGEPNTLDLSQNEADGAVTIRFHRPAGLVDSSTHLEWSDDLTTWSTDHLTTEILSQDGATEWVEVQLDPTVHSEDVPLFFRLAVEMLSP